MLVSTPELEIAVRRGICEVTSLPWPPYLCGVYCRIQALSVSPLDRSQRMALDLDEMCFSVGAVCGWMPFTLPCSVSKAVCTFPSLFLMKPACFT